VVFDFICGSSWVIADESSLWEGLSDLIPLVRRKPRNVHAAGLPEEAAKRLAAGDELA
jgi:hypothetical protein